VPAPISIQEQARKAVYATGFFLVGLTVLAAAWLILRDRESTYRAAELHLDNFAVVVAEHTRLAIGGTDPGVLQLAPDTAIEPASRAGPYQRFESDFASLYQSLDLGYTGRILLFREDGTLLVALPRVLDGAGRSYARHPIFAHAREGGVSGAMKGAGVIEPDERLVAYRKVRGYPLLVVISSPLDEILERWKRDALVISVGALVFAGVIAAGTLLLGRQVRITEALTREVAENELRLNSIISSAMDAIITIDEKQNIILFNAAAERTFRCSAAEAVGTPLDRFIPERHRLFHRKHVGRFGEAGSTVRRMGGDLVLEGVRANGEEFPIDASISHVTVGGRRFYTVILRDITARKKATDALRRSNEELRQIYEQMHEVREAERTRIARELHDELAQWLTALKMDASWIASKLPPEQAPLVAKAQRMKGVVDNTVAAVRRIAADLRPVMLDDLGLVAAIESLLYDLSERTGIVVRLQGDKEAVDLEEPLATAIYRMVQEALTNVARHSGASTVEVEVRKTDTLHVRVQDNGQGLHPDPNHKSFGLLGIRERARTLGGQAKIYSPPEGGTIVDIAIPLQVHAETGAAT
jgi:PAS domain S-box-containing protein